MKPWEINLAGDDVKLFPNEMALDSYREKYPKQVKKLGVVVVFLYRKQPDMDNMRSYLEGKEIVSFDQVPLVTWVGAVALDKERQRMLQLADRANGSFESKHGWNPLVCIKTNPLESEQDEYSRYQADQIDRDIEELLGKEDMDDGA